jgi:hypothetical protein
MFANKIIWKSPSGEVISCYEKNKVMKENLEEISQVCQDALEDAVLMGCDERQVKAELSKLITTLVTAYPRT